VLAITAHLCGRRVNTIRNGKEAFEMARPEVKRCRKLVMAAGKILGPREFNCKAAVAAESAKNSSHAKAAIFRERESASSGCGQI